MFIDLHNYTVHVHRLHNDVTVGPWGWLGLCLGTDNAGMVIGPWDWLGNTRKANIPPF